jgi:DNA-directed RNA polymerase subunit M/transcription elongation factor TFIIS
MILRRFTPPKYYCEACDFGCSKQCDWDRHIATRKHDFRTNRTNLEPKNAEENDKLKCSQCGRSYAARNSLWYHQRKCNAVKSDRHVDIEPHDSSSYTLSQPVDVLTREILLQLLKNSQELVKITKENAETPHTVNNTITNNNTAHFNVNFFLNEKCKDAINFTDFLNSITLNQADLQTVVKHGHIEGNTKIIAELLDKLGVHRRPIHCTDAKRETVYIRENNEWEREDSELPRIKRLANIVSHKVIQESNKWHEENPDFMKDNEKKEKSLHIMTRVSGGDVNGDEEKKLVKQIIQRVEVDKTPEKITRKK